MKGLILAVVAIAALVVLAPRVEACYSGDGSVVGGGPTFSIVQQPVVASYVQAAVGCVQPQAILAQQVYQQPLVSAVVGGYGYGGAQAILLRPSLFRERVFVPRQRAELRRRHR